MTAQTDSTAIGNVSNGKHGAAGIENGQDLVDDLLQALAKT